MSENRQRLAEAFDALTEAAARIAIELRADDLPDIDQAAGVDPGATDPGSESRSSGSQAPAAAALHGSEAVCPAHGKPFVDGNYGLYCTSLSDDPEWSNARGYCRITPKNVAIYLRKAVAAGKR